MGAALLKELLVPQETFECLMKGLREVAEKYGEHLLDTPTNTISIGMLYLAVEPCLFFVR